MGPRAMLRCRSGSSLCSRAAYRASTSGVGVRAGSAVDQAGDPLGDQRRLALALDLDGDGLGGLESAGVLGLDGGEHAGGADLLADLDRVDEAHLVEAVV